MTAVVVDTDIVSFTFKRDSRIRRYRPHLIGKSLVISFMTLAELNLWPEIYRWGTRRREQLLQHIEGYEIRHSDRGLCQRWAEVMAETQAKGRPMDVADAWNAATALDLGISLVTNNLSDYAAVDGLKVLTAADES